MNRALAVLAAITPLTAGGCFGSPEPWDRPWVDFGCDGPGLCRVRGTLEFGGPTDWPNGRLHLDDGRCLPVDLGSFVARDRHRWDGRRVAIGGQAVARVSEGPCGEQGLFLYAERVSLKRPL